MPERLTRALIIDDDPDFCTLLEKMLKMEHLEVETALSGEEGLDVLYRMKPDLVLLDIMMPGLNGWEVTRRIRQLTNVPIIIISALSQTHHLVRSLGAGADDFITKPFERDELLVRIRLLLQRSKMYSGTPEYAHDYDDGYLSVDIPGQRVFIEGERIRLSATEHKLFEYLFLNAGRVCPATDLLDHVWGSVLPNGNKYLHVYVWKLRNKIERKPGQPRYIQTEHGTGYRFERIQQIKPA